MSDRGRKARRLLVRGLRAKVLYYPVIGNLKSSRTSARELHHDIVFATVSFLNLYLVDSRLRDNDYLVLIWVSRRCDLAFGRPIRQWSAKKLGCIALGAEYLSWSNSIIRPKSLLFPSSSTKRICIILPYEANKGTNTLSRDLHSEGGQRQLGS